MQVITAVSCCVVFSCIQNLTPVRATPRWLFGVVEDESRVCVPMSE